MPKRVLLVLGFVMLAGFVPRTEAATFTVNSTADSSDSNPGDGICDAGGGVCTLRAAIQEANALAGADTIQFAIGTGAQTIAPGSALPMITQGVTIDGTTQPGYSGTPLIEIDGINAGNSNGLNVPTPVNATIRGLLINRFQQSGILLGSNSIIESCHIGTDATKTLNRGNGQDGIRVFEGDDNLIRYNTIAFNAFNGVLITDGANYSFPTFTALTPDRTQIFPTIDFNDNCGNFQHATTGLITDTLGRGFNENFGMRLTATMSVSMAGSYTFSFPNLDDNLRLMIDGVERLNTNGGSPSVNVNLIGIHSIEVDFWEGAGAASLKMNVSGPGSASFTSGGPGFQGELFQGSLPATGNRISQNSIFNNGQQGIALGGCRDTNDANDIDYGANTFLNYPVITSHTENPGGSITIQGTAPVGSVVEVFGSTNDATGPGAGYGEGKVYVGTSAIVDGTGTFTVTFILPVEYNSVTTTATDASGNTSEFSANRYVRLNQITVANTNDSGPGSLRDAIFQANGDGVATNIYFDPSLSGQTITVSSSLPALTENGTTVNGDINADCKPDIEVSGNMSVFVGIMMQSAGGRVRGLALNRFNAHAILIENAPASNNQVTCTFIGTTLAGTGPSTNGPYGVEIRNGASNNRVAEFNVFGPFGIAAVRINGGSNNAVGGNKIGLDYGGTVAMPSLIGVQADGTTGTFIGEIANGNRIIATNGAVDVNGGGTIRVFGNTIGPLAGGSATGYGIRFSGGVNGATVGGAGNGEANTIANNGGAGIRVEGGTTDSINIHANSISNNGGLGIDLDAPGVTPNDAGDGDGGPNELQNFPILTSATTNGTSTTINGFLDSPVVLGNYVYNFYTSPAADPSGYGEGATHIGERLGAPGPFSFSFPAVPEGTFVTATATANNAGHTSEFSLAIPVTGPVLGASELVAWPIAPTSIQLQWRDPNAGETGFRIERRLFGGSFALLTNVGPDVTSYVDPTVQPGTQGWYRVIATSPGGDAPPSNVASERAYHTSAQQTCRTKQNLNHLLADATSAVWNGTNWAVAWSDNVNGPSNEIHFQFMNAGNGSPIATATQLTNDAVPSLAPTLVWNGTNYGLFWYDHVRTASGDTKSRLSFALLGPGGNKLRGDMRVIADRTTGGLNPDGTTAIVWDGGGWGVFLFEAVNSPSDLVYYRLDEDGDVLVNGIALTTTNPSIESSVSAAWNGTEYGVSWVEQNGPGSFQVRFQKMQNNGTLIPPLRTLASGPASGFLGTSTIWDGTGWAVAWSEQNPAGERIVHLNRLAADGTPGGSPVRISNDGAVNDYFPKLFTKPGGGYVIFTESIATSGAAEVGRLEADANGARAGSRIIVSADDGFDSQFPRAAASGTSFLVAFSETRVNPSEIGTVVVSPAGVPGSVNDVTTNHPAPNFSSSPAVIALLDRFVALWVESYAGGATQLHARITRSDNTTTDFRPLNGAVPVRRVAAVPYSAQFAIAWTDVNTGGVHFQRFDNNGAPSGGPVQIATGANVFGGVGMAYSGELFGVVWRSGSNMLMFQRVDEASNPIGAATSVGNAAGTVEPQIQWIGSGWAIVWRTNQNLFYARLAPSGALLVPPAQVTDNFANPADYQLLFTGQHLGLVWTESRSVVPGIDIYFTVIDANGFKQFAPVAVASTQFADRFPSMYFDGTNFRIVYPEVAGGIRDAGVSPAGAIIASPRFYGNHGEGRISVAYNGATLAMAWSHQSDILFQTTQCLTDSTPPPCSFTFNGTFSAGAVQLTWAPIFDSQSGILAYHVYRDGKLLAELLPTTTSYADGGFTPGATHSYELRAFNGAYLEATGCTAKNVVAGIVVSPASLPNAVQNQNYNQTITASQGTPPYTFAVTSGALPSGFSLNTNSGVLSGQTSTAGLSNFTITATDSVSATGARAYSLRICPSATIFPTVLPDPIVNAPYSQNISSTNAPFTAAITGGALPAGLTLASSGTLSGTPTVTGSFTFTVTTTSNFGCTNSQSYTFTVLNGLAPRNAFAMAQSSSSMLVKWDRPLRGETGFRIERSTDGTTWGAINNVGADVTSLLDSGLAAATLYYYRVVAYSGSTDAGTSSATAAMTFPLGPTKICQQVIGPYHARAQAMSVAHDGTRWAAAWRDRRDNLLEEIYFQFLDNATGAPVGVPVRVTTTDMSSGFPTLRWNGSHFGLLYTESLRGPAGEVTSTTNFARVDASGSVLRSGVQVSAGAGFLTSASNLPLQWDGGGWGVFTIDAQANPPADLYYRRLSPAGDVVTGPVRLTTGAAWEYDITPFWNGTEYGLAWLERVNTTYTLKFQRMQSDGTLIGTPVTLETSVTGESFSSPNLTWNGSEWALVWSSSTTEEIVRLRRLNPDGSPKGPAVRISDDPSVNPSQPVDDFLPIVHPKSGGGYLVFTLSFNYTTQTVDVARLEADAAGNRAGSRVFLTPSDTIGANFLRTATDGTRFLVAHDAATASQNEAAIVVVDASGNVTNGPTNVTSGHGGGNSVSFTMVPLGAGFAAIWNENTATPQLQAKIFDGGGNLSATKTPLSPTTGVRSRVGAVGVGNTFAVAWRDGTSLRFGRYSSAGDPLITEAVLPSNGNQAFLGWNGEHYGLAFYEGSSLRFQRLNADGTTSGPKVTVADGAQGNIPPQMLWVGTGWVIVWRSNSDFWYALLDRNGAYVVPPIRFTFTATPKNVPILAFSGDRIGVVWGGSNNIDPPGQDVWFTALNLDGTKVFAEKVLVSTPFSDGSPSIYWDQNRFRVVYLSGNGGTMELAVQSDGTLVPGERVFHNRQLTMNVAFNGVTLGMIFNGLYDLTVQTGACFDDTTAPPCPNPATDFNGQRVRLTWPFVSDAESGIVAYNVYRDGVHIAEVGSNVGLHDDFGFVSGATHVYEVRAVNRAYRESAGCTTRSVVAGIAVLPSTLPNGNVGSNYTQTFSGSQGTAPYTFAVTSGTLAAGLTLNSTTGVLSGTPTTSGLFSFTITATDATSAAGSRAYALRICSGITVYPTILPDGYLNASYNQTIVAAGAVGAVTLTITSGSLPAGLTLDPTGWLHGTATSVGTSNFTISATDSLGCSASRAYSIVIGTGSAVRNLSAIATGTASIRLRWTDPQRNENGFRLERSTDLGATWTPFTIVGPDVTTYNDSALAAGVTYSYRAIATSPGGDAPASNLATAMTFPATAAKTCIQQVSPYHAAARSPSVAWNGSQWAMVYQDRRNGENEELYFTFLDATGAMTGTPVRITSTDSTSLRPTLRWNGSKFGIMWLELIKKGGGELLNPYRFALLDASGNVLRSDVRITAADELSQSSFDQHFFWDGSAWGFFDSRFTGGGLLDVYFHRFDEDGDPLAGPIRLTTDAAADFGVIVDWNGSEYGMVWTRAFDTDNSSFLFQRVSAAGAPIGSPTTIATFGQSSFGGIDVTSTASGWAVTWGEATNTEDVIYLRRLDASGALVGGATRLSDDFDLNGFTLADQRPVSDIFPEIFALPAGGYVVFTRAFLNVTQRNEVAVLRADASGVRLGTRQVVSTQDSFHSGSAKAAFNGTNFLAAFNESRLGTQEIASVVVNPSGGIVSGPTDLTSGHSLGNNVVFTTSGNPQVAGVGGGFAALWTELVSASEVRVYAKIFDGSGALAATKSPLSTRNARSRPAAVGVGNTFATAWRDNANAVVFGRWDASGNPLITPVDIATGQGGPPHIAIGFDGEHYGVVWHSGGRLQFQRVSATGALVGTRTTLAPQAQNLAHQIAWTGSGWAVVFAIENDIWYALLDINGAVSVAPIRVTFTPDDFKGALALSWSGTALGVAYASVQTPSSPGQVIGFTVLNLDGIRQFNDVFISEGRFNNTLQALNWDVDRFRLAFVPGESGTLREVDLSATGSILGASRMVANRGGTAAAMWNGATLGVIWSQLGELFFETTACLADATPPPCPSFSASRSSGPVTVSWTPVTDAESGIYRYAIYRDGVMIGEANATSTSFVDAGVRPSDNHTYGVVAVNGAFRESASCATQPVVTLPGTLTATATSASSVQAAWGAAAGATAYQLQRSSNGTTWTTIGTPTGTSFTDTTVAAATSYLYRVLAMFGVTPSPPGNVDLATTVIFTDDPLVAGMTVKSAHLSEARTAVNAVRTLAARPAFAWTDTPAAGLMVKATHMNELRTALNDARTALGLASLTFTDAIGAGAPVRAIHWQEVRNGVK